MTAVLQTESCNIEMTFRWSCDVNNVRASRFQKFPKICKILLDRKTLVELPGHERFTVTDCNDFTSLYPLYLQSVGISNLAASHNGDFKHIVHPVCRLRCIAAFPPKWIPSASILTWSSISGCCNASSSTPCAIACD